MTGVIRELGVSGLGFVRHLGAMSLFAARIASTVIRPPWRPRLIIEELHKLGVMSLLIICVSGLAVGMVLGLQGYNTLVRFGAENSLGAVVGLSLVREFGPVISALLITGRAGSATTAEIGTMVATAQLDGLRMMSVDPIDYVVRPKAIGMILVTPLLNALFIVCGLFGAYLVGVALMGLDPGTFASGMESSVDFADDIVGSAIKSTVFGLIIGLVSTYRGFTCQPTSVGVSSATTSTVVIGSVSVLIFDYFITALWGV